FADACFTHVWLVETLPQMSDPAPALAEAWRVVRPGGYLAMQEPVAPHPARAPVLEGVRFATLEIRPDAAPRPRFVRLDAQPIAEVGERSARVVAARARLHARLEAASDAELRAIARERAVLAAALDDGSVRLIQVVARRP